MAYQFKNKVAVITGGAHGIGKAVAEKSRTEGAAGRQSGETGRYCGNGLFPVLR